MLVKSSVVLILGRLHALIYIEQAKGNQQIYFLLNVMERSSLGHISIDLGSFIWRLVVIFAKRFRFWIPLSIIDDY